MLFSGLKHRCLQKDSKRIVELFLSNYLRSNFYFFSFSRLLRLFAANARPSPLDTRRCLQLPQKGSKFAKKALDTDAGLSTLFFPLPVNRHPPPPRHTGAAQRVGGSPLTFTVHSHSHASLNETTIFSRCVYHLFHQKTFAVKSTQHPQIIAFLYYWISEFLHFSISQCLNFLVFPSHSFLILVTPESRSA